MDPLLTKIAKKEKRKKINYTYSLENMKICGRMKNPLFFALFCT